MSVNNRIELDQHVFGRDLLTNIRERSCSTIGGGLFIPKGTLKSTVAEDVIAEIIANNPKIREDQRSFFVSLIQEEALLVFSILLHDGNDAYIPQFLYQRAYDSGLPFSVATLEEFLPSSISRTFEDRQWEYLAVDFHRGALHIDLSHKAVLPFLEDAYVGSGAFGEVFRVKIHAGCQHIVNGAERAVFVARKQLRIGSHFDDESLTLELLRKLRHPNIIELFTSYTYRNAYNMLFPLAEMDLQKFFRSKVVVTPSIFGEIFGLADALAQLHSFTLTENGYILSKIGYHHDLRPANILVKGTKFLISDFGLSKLKPEDGTSKSRLRGGDDDYLSPESFNETDWTNGNVGRALDIWSFGCILAEFATFIDGQSVEEFRESRKSTHGTEWLSITDNAFHINGKLRPAVGDWLDRLVNATTRPGIIELVSLSRKMLNPVWRRRITISGVVENLAKTSLLTQTSVILERFSKVDIGDSQPGKASDILLYLEGTRFSAWNQAYRSESSSITQESIETTLKILRDLVVNIEAHSKYGMVKNSRKVDLDSHKHFDNVCGAIDGLQSNLSSFGQAEMNKLWIRNVAEIDDSDILLQIKNMRSPGRYRAVGIKAAMKYMSRAISQSISTGGTSMLRDQGGLEIEDEDEEDHFSDESSERAERVIGDWEGNRVIVEWTNYNQQWMGAKGSAMSIRMEELAKFLNPSLTPRIGILAERVLNCIGYFHDFKKWRFGFMYDMPQGASEGNNCYKLAAMMRSSSTQPVQTLRPALGDIFKLAHGLASSVYSLHEIGWLHKGVTSENILLFSPSGGDATEHLSNGILAGFSQSRREGSSGTLGPSNAFRLYQHPLYKDASSNFRRSFDYYSLGIVLLELGLWITVYDIWENSEQGRVNQILPEQLKGLILTEYVPRLRTVMGTTYQDAVNFCINSEAIIDLSTDEKENQRLFHAAFKDRVVDPLGKCFA